MEAKDRSLCLLATVKRYWTDALVGLTIGTIAVIWVVLTANDIGVGYDEPIYAGYSLKYLAWFQYLWRAWLSGDFFSPFSFEVIEKFWRARDMHPSFPKVLAAFGHLIGRSIFGDDLASMRLGTALLFGLLVSSSYWFAKSAMNRPAALFVSLGIASTPRLIGDAHFLTMDSPVAATSFIATLLLPRLLRLRFPWWLIWGSITFGLAFSSKANGFLIVPAASLWIAAEAVIARSQAQEIHVAKRLVKVVLIGVGGLAFVFLTWLWLWSDPIGRFRQYFVFHFRHFGVHTFYLGKLWDFAPWHYPFVMIMVTTPIIYVFMFIASSLLFIRHWKLVPPSVRLSLISFLVHIFPFTLLSTPKYNGVRLFEASLPFMLFVSGYGVFLITRWLESAEKLKQSLSPVSRFLLIHLVPLILVSPAVKDTVACHPFEISYYNSLVGGIRGAVYKWGFEGTYWGVNLINAVPFLNRLEGEKSLLLIPHSLCSYMEFYKNGGLLRPNIKIMGDPNDIFRADYVLIQASQTEWELLPAHLRRLVWRLWRSERPDFAAQYNGVPMVALYGAATVIRVVKETGWNEWDAKGGGALR